MLPLTPLEATLTGFLSVSPLGATLTFHTPGGAWLAIRHRSAAAARRSRSFGTRHCFYKPFGMNVYKLPFCYPLQNECLRHYPGGGAPKLK